MYIEIQLVLYIHIYPFTLLSSLIDFSRFFSLFVFGKSYWFWSSLIDSSRFELFVFGKSYWFSHNHIFWEDSLLLSIYMPFISFHSLFEPSRASSKPLNRRDQSRYHDHVCDNWREHLVFSIKQDVNVNSLLFLLCWMVFTKSFLSI